MRLVRILSAVALSLNAIPAEAREAARPACFDRYVGRELRILDGRGIERRGRLMAADGQQLRLLIPTGEVAVPLEDVRRIDRRGDSVKEGLVLGMLWPAVMWPLGAAQGFDSEAKAWAALPAAMAVWGGIGAGIDALRKGWTPVYRADRPSRASFAVAPTRRGVRVAYVKQF